MAFENCLAEIKAASGDRIDDREAGHILQVAFDRASRYEKDGMARADAAIRAARELGDEERIKAAVEKRSRLINIERRRELDASVIEGKEADTFRAALAGVEGGERGWGLSVDAQAHQQSGELLGGAVDELRQSGMLKPAVRRNKDLERDIAREMWRGNEPEKWPATGNEIAAQIAGVLSKYTELARVKMNDAGAFIRKIENYVTRQSHDQWKLRKGGFEAWRDDIMPKLDERTFEGVEDREKFLGDIYAALVSGIHDSSSGGDWLAGFKGPANLARKMSEERVLHFKDADSFFDYNERWGRGGIVENSFRSLEHAGRNIALMRKFGPNPEAMAKDWADSLAKTARDRNDFAQARKLKADWNDRLIDAVMGRGAVPDYLVLAQIGQGFRIAETLSKLGSVVLSSLPDMGVSAATLRWNGVPLFSRWGNMIATPFRGRRTGVSREVADKLGLGLDTLRGQIVSRFYAGDGFPGMGGKLVETFHRANLLGYWTDSFKTTTGLLVANNLGELAGREFGALDRRLQLTLRRFGIEGPEWDAMRQAERRAADGRDYLTPGAMLSLPDEAVAHLLPEGATPRQIDQLRDDLRSKLGTYISEQTREGMTEPTAADRAISMLGTKPGTPAGEALRLLVQFKQFPITMIRRSLNREWNRGGGIDVGGLVGLMVSTSLLGYAAMTLKGLARGQNPRAPDDAQGYAKTVMAAMAQGGGLGIYGDFLFGQYNRMGGGLAGTLAGPAVGTADQFMQMLDTIKNGSTHKERGQLLAAEGVRFLANNAPFINLFYTRAAIDYLFLYKLQESVNPGFARRLEQKVKQENNQTFWLRPTQAVH